MTDTQWTSEQIATEFTDCETVGQLIARLEGIVSQRGEVICEIRVNGQLLSETDEAKFAAEPCSQISSLVIRTDQPETLIRQAVHSAVSFIPLLSKASIDTATWLREGEITKAGEQLDETMEGYQWFVETIHHARGAASGLGLPVANVERWHEAEKLLHKAIADLTKTFDRKDYVVAADILEYDMTTALDMWEPILSKESSQRGI